MFQAALLETMNTALAPCRTAVSISMALMPKAPSPVIEITCRSGIGQGRGDGVGHADAEAAERAGVHVGLGGEADAGEAQEVAAVGDRDVVGSADLGRSPRRCGRDGSCRPIPLRRRTWRSVAERSTCWRAQPFGPSLIGIRRRGCPPPRRCLSASAGVASSSGSPRRLSISSPAVVGDADEAGVREHGRRAVAESGSRACGRSRRPDRPRPSPAPRMAPTTRG